MWFGAGSPYRRHRFILDLEKPSGFPKDGHAETVHFLERSFGSREQSAAVPDRLMSGFFLNFSTSEEQVRELEAKLRQIANGRLYQLDTTTSIALSPDWTETRLVPRVAGAIKPGG